MGCAVGQSEYWGGISWVQVVITAIMLVHRNVQCLMSLYRRDCLSMIQTMAQHTPGLW